MAPIRDSGETADATPPTRSKRQVSKSKARRLDVLQKLRDAKSCGSKLKYEVGEVEQVYEEVDELEYSELVRKRQDEDFIIDDDGTGYAEDGREIFDDDFDVDESELGNRKKRKETSHKKFAKSGSGGSEERPAVKSRNIKNMFLSGAGRSKAKLDKKTEKQEENVLEDILGELKASKPTHAKLGMSCRPVTSSSARYANPFSMKQRKTVSSSHKDADANGFTRLGETNQTQHRIQNKLPALSVQQNNSKKARLSGKQNLVAEDVADIEQFDSMDVDCEMDADNVPAAPAADDDDDDRENVIGNFTSSIQDTDGNGAQTFVQLNDADTNKSHFNEDICDTNGIVPQTPVSQIERISSYIAAEMNHMETGWDDMKLNDTKEEPLQPILLNTDTLPLIKNDEGDDVLRFYWIDAYEDYFKQTGTVYLFGKVWVPSVKSHVSCCVIVKNIQRVIYLLPRDKKQSTGEEVTLNDVYAEFDKTIAEKNHINPFKCKPVEKCYAFELYEVPAKCTYLEVRYSHDFTTLSSVLSGDTFSHVFGTNTSCLEMFLLERNIKGPCWLDITVSHLSSPPLSWCKLEVVVNDMKHISVSPNAPPPPPVVMLTLSMRTALNTNTHQNEIIGVGCLFHTEFPLDKGAPKPPFRQHFYAMTYPSGCIMPFDFNQKASKCKITKIEVLGSERNLLSFLLAKIQKMDPDVLVTHNFFGFDIDLLLKKMESTNVPHWSRIGRLRRANMPKANKKGSHVSGIFHKSVMSGRLVVDTKVSSQELIRCKSYDLTELVSQVLQKNRIEIPPDCMHNMYSSSEQLMQLVECTMADASFTLNLMCELNVLPLAIQITNIAGNVLSHTLHGGRSERNEFLLLHAFHEKDYICPDKRGFERKQGKGKNVAADNPHEQEGDDTVVVSKSKKKASYSGGLVLEPKKGFYDKYILLLDFNSLYPSIIQEFNICFTTLEREPYKETEDGVPIVDMPASDAETGILPSEIRKLVESRKAVKGLMKMKNVSPELMMQYDIRQKALKLTANSMYGCLGFSNSRFFAKHLAALVTGKGREILLHTKHLTQKHGLDVIYGDTDSIMVNTNSINLDEVYQLGNKIKAEVNKQYRKLELDIDGVFKSMLLLKKKKYAALKVVQSPSGEISYEKELKGLDIVRRDWSDLAREVGNYVIEQILSADCQENIVERIHDKLREVAEQVREEKLPLKVYEINKQLTKNPEDYPDKKSLPHVQVALRLNSKGGKTLRHGDTICYVICEDGSCLPATQRAYHPDEVRSQDNLKIDVKYYLSQQLHPVVARLCDPIDGTDSAQIADCLGLDPSTYHRSVTHHAEDDVGAARHYADRFKHCDVFKVKCPSPACQADISFEKLMQNEFHCSLENCPTENCSVKLIDHVSYICNQLTQVIRKHISTYYMAWMKCDDVTCAYRTRVPSARLRNGHPVCEACERGTLHLEYTDTQLYNQLLYYQYVFDTEKALDELDGDKGTARGYLRDYTSTYHQLKLLVDGFLAENAYGMVDLGKLFAWTN